MYSFLFYLAKLVCVVNLSIPPFMFMIFLLLYLDARCRARRHHLHNYKKEGVQMRILILKMTLSDGQVVFLPSFVREDDVVTIHLPDWATKVNIIREEPKPSVTTFTIYATDGKEV